MNDFYLRPPSMYNTLSHLIYTNFKTNSHNKIVYNKTPSKTFNFFTKYIHFETCPFHLKLSMLPSHISGLLHKLIFKKYMLVELCASNYATLYGLVSGIYRTFQNYIKKIQNH
jgi:hypothetical protein